MEIKLFKEKFCLVIVLVACFCNFPYQPKQFVLPEVPYKFPSGSTIKEFADNAKNVKLAFTLREGSRCIYYVDFNDTAPRPIKLKKPAGKENLDADSPIISPDGSFVAYYLTQGTTGIYGAYIQKIDPSAEPTAIAANGTEPHWWVNPQGETFVIYSDNMQVAGPLALGKGMTYKQRVPLSDKGGVAGDPMVIAPYPMNGGLSKNGQFLCTGYERAAFYDISGAQLIPINSDPVPLQVCNPSIDPDSAHQNWMMFLSFSGVQSLINPYKGSSDYPAMDTAGALPLHAVFFIADITNTVIDFVPISVMGENYRSWQDPEWSNDPRFAAALAMIDETRADFVLVKNIGDRSKKKEILTVTRGTGKMDVTSTPYVWIGR
jgi:hypothetical protein